jgi:3,4-dihydroxy 2-butanone 4-phosphate synthase/GTP cyclohydrolase II
MVLLVDDEDRENEGDLVVAAEFATPEAIAFMAKKACGLICLALTGSQIDRLGLSPMVAMNRARRSTAFTVSIEAREGITTGISAFDRAHTIRVAADPEVEPGAIVSPGHVFPLRAADGGVLARNGHTEGAIDLMRLAGLAPAAVICEVMGESGHMAQRPELNRFAAEHDIPVLTIAELVEHRWATERLVEEVASADLPTAYADGVLRVHAFKSVVDGMEHLAIVRAPFGRAPLVRVHSECLTGDALGSLRCDCGPQLNEAQRLISEDSQGGVVVYLRGQEGRGIGLGNKIRAYALQDQGLDTLDANTALGLPADARHYGIAAQILKALGIDHLRLLTNNPAKAEALAGYGLNVDERLPLVIPPNPFNRRYLATKVARFGHSLCQHE